jgi:hypothetical protein
MSLHCLVYTSVANKKMSDEDLKKLLVKIRAKNSLVNITGMLLYLDPFFLQVLEGEANMLDELFNIIKQDSRHHKVSLIYKKPLEERVFSNWTMGFNRVNAESLDTVEGFSDFWRRPTSEFFSGSPNVVENLLERFRNETLF